MDNNSLNDDFNSSQKLFEKDFEIVTSSMNLETADLPATKPNEKKTLKIKVSKDEKSRLKILDKMKTMSEGHTKLEKITKVFFPDSRIARKRLLQLILIFLN